MLWLALCFNFTRYYFYFNTSLLHSLDKDDKGLKMNIKMLKAALAGLVLSVSGFSNATLITFNDAALFEAAAGTLNTEDFSSEAVEYSTANYSGVFGGFTLTSLSNGDNNGILNSLIASSGAGDVSNGIGFFGQNFYGWGNNDGGLGPQSNFSFSSSISAFGFDYFNADFSDSYNITVNGSVLNTIATNSNGFFGVIAVGENITSAIITNLTTGGYVGAAGLDNVRVSVQVPEPSTLAIFALGIMGLASRRFKKQ